MFVNNVVRVIVVGDIMISLKYLFELEKIWAQRLRNRAENLKENPQYGKLQDIANYNHINPTQIRYTNDNITKSIQAQKALNMINKKGEQAERLASAVEHKHQPEIKSHGFVDKLIKKSASIIADPFSKDTVKGQLGLANKASKEAREIKKTIYTAPKFSEKRNILFKNLRQSMAKG